MSQPLFSLKIAVLNVDSQHPLRSAAAFSIGRLHPVVGRRTAKFSVFSGQNYELPKHAGLAAFICFMVG